MKQLQSLIWKEWHEAQLFLWIAWGLFIGLPLINGFDYSSGHTGRFMFIVAPWIQRFGPVLAVVIGVTVSCRDVWPKLEDFWQSRPIGGVRLFVVKYIVAGTVVLLACGVPIGIELVLNDKTAASPGVLWDAFVWLAAYSIGFATGCVLRRSTHAAVMAFVGLLLLYVVPIVFPPLNGLNINYVDQRYFLPWAVTLPPLKFLGGMLLVAAAMASLGVVAVRYHWHIESSKPLIYGTIAAGFLILIESASYQLGTNLPVLQQVHLPGAEEVDWIGKGSAGYLVESSLPNTPNDSGIFYRTVKIEGSKLLVGPVRKPAEMRRILNLQACSTTKPLRQYEYSSWYPEGSEDSDLNISRNAPGNFGDLVRRIVLWQSPLKHFSSALVYRWKNRLYVVGQKSLVFDLSDPANPRLIKSEAIRYEATWSEAIEPVVRIKLPPALGLPPEERLKFFASLNSSYFRRIFDGQVLCELVDKGSEHTIAMYRLLSLTSKVATYKLVTTFKPSLVQSMSGMRGFAGQLWEYRMGIHKGFLFVKDGPDYLAVFNLTGPHPLTLIGHFVPKGLLGAFTVLPDGRILAGGDSLWLLGPPRRR